MAKKSSGVTVVLASRIKDVARKSKLRVSGDFVDGVNAVVLEGLKRAVDRCKANGRQTLRAQDM